MEFRAQARYMRVSPQKARLVLDLIKGRRVEDALNTLTFTNKRVAATIQKLLRSAVENANYLSSEKGIDVDIDSLYVKRAIENELAERGKSGESVATVVGTEKATGKAPARVKAKRKAPVSKKKVGARK